MLRLPLHQKRSPPIDAPFTFSSLFCCSAAPPLMLILLLAGCSLLPEVLAGEECPGSDRDFWNIPIGEKTRCNIESLECRQLPQPWDPRPPCLILLSHPELRDWELRAELAERSKDAEALRHLSCVYLLGPSVPLKTLNPRSVQDADTESLSGLFNTLLDLLKFEILPLASRAYVVFPSACEKLGPSELILIMNSVTYGQPLIPVDQGLMGGVTRDFIDMLVGLESAALTSESSLRSGTESVTEALMALAAQHLETRIGGVEEVASPLPGSPSSNSSQQPVVVVSVVFSQPQMLEYQIRTFKKHLVEGFEQFIAVIDTADRAMRQEFQQICEREGARYLISPFETASTRGADASWMHGQCLDWMWHEVILQEFSEHLIFITEQDVFLLGAYSLRKTLDPTQSFSKNTGACPQCTISGVLQVRENEDSFPVEYLHPSAIVIDLKRISMPTGIYLSPANFNGSELDTGGSLAAYFQMAEEMALEEAENGRCLRVCHLQHRYAGPETCFFESKDQLGLPDIYDEVVLHTRRSSAWDIRMKHNNGEWDKVRELQNIHQRRMECIWETWEVALAMQ